MNTAYIGWDKNRACILRSILRQRPRSLYYTGYQVYSRTRSWIVLTTGAQPQRSICGSSNSYTWQLEVDLYDPGRQGESRFTLILATHKKVDNPTVKRKPVLCRTVAASGPEYIGKVDGLPIEIRSPTRLILGTSLTRNRLPRSRFLPCM